MPAGLRLFTRSFSFYHTLIIMGAGKRVIIVMRAITLMAALAVIGLGAWGKVNHTRWRG